MITSSLVLLIGKFVSSLSRMLHLGAGATWPGEIALRFNPPILNYFVAKLEKGIIIVAGTNGKTTTAKMIQHILVNSDPTNSDKIIHNDSGANLLNGLISAFINKTSWSGSLQADWAILEVDENTLSLVLKDFNSYSSRERSESRSPSGKSSRLRDVPSGTSLRSNNKALIIVFLNLFRDQLDRYGEVDVIAQKWNKALAKLPKETQLILNADDPLIAYLGKAVKSRPGLEASVSYLGLDDPKLFQKQMEHATDSIFCLNCGSRLSYEGIYYSHIGIWKCEKCGEKRPKLDISEWKSPLAGVYNKYNTLAAVGVAKLLGIPDKQVNLALADFSPAFGRQEEFEVNGKKIKIFLSKNPAGFNASLRTVIELGAKQILLVLNDRIPDGRDVSWIWDVDFEMIPNYAAVIVSGDRVYDMALRIKYTQGIQSASWRTKFKIYENLRDAIHYGLRLIKKEETLYILPTYSAMLEVRRILRGRKIL